MLLRRQFRYCVTSLADVGEESITTQYSLSQWPPRLVERLNCSMYYTEIPFTFCCPFGARQKIIFFAAFSSSRFISMTMIKITHTLMKKGLTRSLMWGHLAHLFRGSVLAEALLLALLSFFGSFWGRSYDYSPLVHLGSWKRREEALGSSLERNLARCFCFGFPSIFPIFCLSFPTRLEAQTMEIHLLHYWCISPLILASNLSLEFELYWDWEGLLLLLRRKGRQSVFFPFRKEALKRTWRVKMEV